MIAVIHHHRHHHHHAAAPKKRQVNLTALARASTSEAPAADRAVVDSTFTLFCWGPATLNEDRVASSMT